MEQDQLDELEALSAIFVDEYEQISLEQAQPIIESMGWMEDDIKHVVSLKLAPQPDDSGDIHVSAEIICAMPSSYPLERAALVACPKSKGLSHTHVDELLAAARKAADEGIGMASIFMVAEAVKEWLQANNLAGLDGSMYSDMMRRIQNKEMEKKMESERAAIRRAADSEKRVGEAQIDEAELERIRKRQAGTMVTMETFVAWKKNFDEEMARKQDSQAANKGMEKVSGKQWFLNQQASGVPASWLAEEDELLAKLSAEVEQEQLQEVEEEEEDSEEDEDYVDEGGDDDDDDDADESESI